MSNDRVCLIRDRGGQTGQAGRQEGRDGLRREELAENVCTDGYRDRQASGLNDGNTEVAQQALCCRVCRMNKRKKSLSSKSPRRNTKPYFHRCRDVNSNDLLQKVFAFLHVFY